MVHIFPSSTASLHVLSVLFVYMCLSVWLLQIYLLAIFFYLFGSSRFGYLSVLPIDLSIVLSISLLTYLRTCFVHMYIYIEIFKYIYRYTVYILHLYHLVISSLCFYCQTVCNSPFSVSSIYLLLFLPVCTYFSSLFSVCVWVCFVLVCLLFFPRT